MKWVGPQRLQGVICTAVNRGSMPHAENLGNGHARHSTRRNVRELSNAHDTRHTSEWAVARLAGREHSPSCVESRRPRGPARAPGPACPTAGLRQPPTAGPTLLRSEIQTASRGMKVIEIACGALRTMCSCRPTLFKKMATRQDRGRTAACGLLAGHEICDVPGSFSNGMVASCVRTIIRGPASGSSSLDPTQQHVVHNVVHNIGAQEMLTMVHAMLSAEPFCPFGRLTPIALYVARAQICAVIAVIARRTDRAKVLASLLRPLRPNLRTHDLGPPTASAARHHNTRSDIRNTPLSSLRSSSSIKSTANAAVLLHYITVP